MNIPSGKLILSIIFFICFGLVDSFQNSCSASSLARPYYYYRYSYFDDDYLERKSYSYKLNCKISILENEDSLKIKTVPAINITTIDFDGSKLNKIPSGIFSNYKNVTLINLGFVNLTEIEPGAFKGMTKLSDLQLHYNNLSTIKNGTLSDLIELEDLDLSYNKLTSAPELKKLVGLRDLNLEHNQFKNLNDLYMNSLHRLDISHNNITVLDKPIAMRYSMWLYNGHIDLSYNQIEIVTPGIFVGRLSTINLSYNKIHTISFENLCSNANFSHNAISSLSTFADCLRRLDVSYNKITTIPLHIFEEAMLIYLDLSHNNITELHVDTFTNQTSLQSLYLNHNNISKIEVGTFHYLMELISLDLSYNNIETIPYGMFSGLQSLEDLTLSGNKIKILAPGTLLSLFDLRKLHLDNNSIQNFDFILLAEHMDYLRMINLDNNDITCDWLATAIHKAKKYNSAIIVTGRTTKDNNINGIRCNSNQTLATTAETPKIKVTKQEETETAKIIPHLDSSEEQSITHQFSLTQSMPNNFEISNISLRNQERLKGIMSSVMALTTIILLLLIVVIGIICLAVYRKYVSRPRNSLETIQLMDAAE